jgi:hypothetical protein
LEFAVGNNDSANTLVYTVIDLEDSATLYFENSENISIYNIVNGKIDNFYE